MVYESFVPEKYYRDLRSLVRTRLNRVHNITKHKNMIYAILAKYDYTKPTNQTFSKKGIEWMKTIVLSEIDRMSMDAYLQNIIMNQKQIDIFEAKIATISNEDQRARLIMSIPGINYVTALTIISEIVDIKRFFPSIPYCYRYQIFLDFICLRIVNPTAVGAAIYIPKLSTITEIPSPKTSASFPSSAKAIIDRVDIIGVINALTAS